MSITGLHHITIVTADAKTNLEFYTGVLGLRLVKKTVNFDDPGSYHLYYGDELGRPGTLITFFEWKNAPKGQRGIGGTHHYALAVADYAGLLKWKRRLTDLGVRVSGPLNRLYFQSIYFTDPDGTIIEIATKGPGWTVDEAPDELGQIERIPPESMEIANRDRATIDATTHTDLVPEITPDMKLEHGLHHISAVSSDIARTDKLLRGVLGLNLVKRTANFDDPSSKHWYWGAGEGKPGTVITYFENDPRKVPRSSMGTGLTHHYAFATENQNTQLELREKLLAAGVNVSPVMDRIYFKSIYFTDPNGHILEIATNDPGFLVDETRENLGSRLQLPAWLEANRQEIERGLQAL
jgi:glyoxalase family protein